jgi:predicted protein tyrosine phosphatase
MFHLLINSQALPDEGIRTRRFTHAFYVQTGVEDLRGGSEAGAQVLRWHAGRPNPGDVRRLAALAHTLSDGDSVLICCDTAGAAAGAVALLLLVCYFDVGFEMVAARILSRHHVSVPPAVELVGAIDRTCGFDGRLMEAARLMAGSPVGSPLASSAA